MLASAGGLMAAHTQSRARSRRISSVLAALTVDLIGLDALVESDR